MQEDCGLGLGRVLRSPASMLLHFRERLADGLPLPWLLWTQLFLIAVLGSCVYGASLALVVPSFDLGGGAAWLTLGAGGGWLLFGPAQLLATRLPALVAAQACMVTMAYGEGVLLVGAMLNVASWLTGAAGEWCVPFNFAWVGISNVVMASVLAIQLKAVGVAPWKPSRCGLFFSTAEAGFCSGFCIGPSPAESFAKERVEAIGRQSMQKNPLTMLGEITQCWLFTYSSPEEQVRKHLPPELELITLNGRAFWNIVVCELRHMRPAPLPAWTGIRYRHAAYRIYARYHPPSGEPVGGLYFVRSDCDSKLIARLGNVLTDFRFHHSPIPIEKDEELRLRIEAVDKPGFACIQPNARPNLDEETCFTSLAEAETFLKYEPAGIGVDEHGTVNIVRIGRREDAWSSRLVSVTDWSWSVLDGIDLCPEVCFEVAPIQYRWNRGEVYARGR